MTESTNTNNEAAKKTDFLSLLKSLASLKLTVVCLVILTVLVVWGTVYQAGNGLYQAQQKFFYSWVFFIFGFIPFPGTIMVMFVLFTNLVFSLIFRMRMRLSNIGNVVSHLGIIILLVGGFFTFYFSEESSLMMQEGQQSSWSQSRTQWELAVWEETGGEKEVYAVDTDSSNSGKSFRFADLGIKVTLANYYPNALALGSSAAVSGSKPVTNASGIKQLRKKPPELEVTQNVAGVVLDVADIMGVSDGPRVLLYGQEKVPTAASFNGRTYGFSLRRQRLPLPLNIYLEDFRMKMYPNSTIPKSYESTVKIKSDDGVDREVVVSMNKPLRFADYTFFQSSYYIAPDGTEYSIFAVVKNIGRLMPYISSIIIFMGMLIHFLMMLIRRRDVGNNGTSADNNA
jgi:cytochrome c biogenesis protein ResB